MAVGHSGFGALWGTGGAHYVTFMLFSTHTQGPEVRGLGQNWASASQRKGHPTALGSGDFESQAVWMGSQRSPLISAVSPKKGVTPQPCWRNWVHGAWGELDSFPLLMFPLSGLVRPQVCGGGMCGPLSPFRTAQDSEYY